MLLEMVQNHYYRDDIYINNVIVPHDKVKEDDKLMIKRVLLKELRFPEIAA